MSNPTASTAKSQGTPSDALARNWWAILVRGVVAIMFGAAAFFWPGAAMLAFVFVFAAYLLIDGAFAIVASVRAMAAHQRWGLLLSEGILDLIMAGRARAGPTTSIVAFILIVAAWALITGALMLMASFRLDASHGRWWMLLGGIISGVWAVALVIAPFIGALVLTWWIAGYAIAFGVTMVILAMRLRRHRAAHA